MVKLIKKCICGGKVSSAKRVHKISTVLENPGVVEFKAPAVKCKKCDEYIFSEDDAEKVFDAFDKAISKQKL